MKRTLIATLMGMQLLALSACAHNQSQMAVDSNHSPVLHGILQSKELVVGTAASMPPLNMTTKDGEVIGLDVDIARKLADGMGVKLKLQTMPFANLLPALEAGEVDMVISGMTITPDRNLKFNFVGPYFISGKAFLTKEGKISSAEDISEINNPKFTLAALNGSTSQFFVEESMPKVKLVKTETYDQAVDMVIRGKVDAMIADYPICLVSVLRYPDEGLLSVLTLLTYEPIGIAVPPNDPHFVNWLENFLNNMRESGTLDNLKSRWFDDDSWLQKLPQRQ